MRPVHARFSRNLFIAKDVLKSVFALDEREKNTIYIVHISLFDGSGVFSRRWKILTVTKRYMRRHYCRRRRSARRQQLLIPEHDLFTISIDHARAPNRAMSFQSVGRSRSRLCGQRCTLLYVHNVTRGRAIKLREKKLDKMNFSLPINHIRFVGLYVHMVFKHTRCVAAFLYVAHANLRFFLLLSITNVFFYSTVLLISKSIVLLSYSKRCNDIICTRDNIINVIQIFFLFGTTFRQKCFILSFRDVCAIPVQVIINQVCKKCILKRQRFFFFIYSYWIIFDNLTKN